MEPERPDPHPVARRAEDNLATGFADVDAGTDVLVFANCLRLLDSLPYFQRYRQRAIEWLDLSPGQRVLDIGCGLGTAVSDLAETLGSSSLVLGVDLRPFEVMPR